MIHANGDTWHNTHTRTVTCEQEPSVNKKIKNNRLRQRRANPKRTPKRFSVWKPRKMQKTANHPSAKPSRPRGTGNSKKSAVGTMQPLHRGWPRRSDAAPHERLTPLQYRKIRCTFGCGLRIGLVLKRHRCELYARGCSPPYWGPSLDGFDLMILCRWWRGWVRWWGIDDLAMGNRELPKGAAADVNSGRSGRAPHPSAPSSRRHPAKMSGECALWPGPSLNLVLGNSVEYLFVFGWGCCVEGWWFVSCELGWLFELKFVFYWIELFFCIIFFYIGTLDLIWCGNGRFSLFQFLF